MRTNWDSLSSGTGKPVRNWYRVAWLCYNRRCFHQPGQLSAHSRLCDFHSPIWWSPKTVPIITICPYHWPIGAPPNRLMRNSGVPFLWLDQQARPSSSSWIREAPSGQSDSDNSVIGRNTPPAEVFNSLRKAAAPAPFIWSGSWLLGGFLTHSQGQTIQSPSLGQRGEWEDTTMCCLLKVIYSRSHAMTYELRDNVGRAKRNGEK